MKDIVALLSKYKFMHDKQSDLLNAFQELDHDADGFIPQNELVGYVTEMGEALNEKEVEFMLELAKDKDQVDQSLINIKRLAELMIPSEDILRTLEGKATAIILWEEIAKKAGQITEMSSQLEEDSVGEKIRDLENRYEIEIEEQQLDVSKVQNLHQRKESNLTGSLNNTAAQTTMI